MVGKLFVFIGISLLLSYYFFSETEIHIIRHGEKIIQKGISDAPLTSFGQKQARSVGKALAEQSLTPQIYVSPMRRARQTAQAIAKENSSKLIFDDRLVEKGYYRTKEKYSDGAIVFAKNKNGIKETKAQHMARLLSFVEEKSTFFNRKLWIVAHGGLMARIFERISEETKTPLPRHIKLDYASRFVFSYNKITGKFRFREKIDCPLSAKADEGAQMP